MVKKAFPIFALLSIKENSSDFFPKSPSVQIIVISILGKIIQDSSYCGRFIHHHMK